MWRKEDVQRLSHTTFQDWKTKRSQQQRFEGAAAESRPVIWEPIRLEKITLFQPAYFSGVL